MWWILRWIREKGERGLSIDTGRSKETDDYGRSVIGSRIPDGSSRYRRYQSREGRRGRGKGVGGGSREIREVVIVRLGSTSGQLFVSKLAELSMLLIEFVGENSLVLVSQSHLLFIEKTLHNHLHVFE